MATKADLLSELNWVTEKISSQVWTLNLGTLGTTWSLLIATAVPETIRFTPRNAVWVVIPSLLSLLCEMGQVLAAYSLDRKLLKKMEEIQCSRVSISHHRLALQTQALFFSHQDCSYDRCRYDSAVHLGTEICRVKGPRYEKESQEKGASR
jgi:hypothetical protein